MNRQEAVLEVRKSTEPDFVVPLSAHTVPPVALILKLTLTGMKSLP